jgi:hypothetical protein
METSASRLEFTGAAEASDLLQASFDGPQPDVRVVGGVVTVRYRRQPVAAFSTRLAKVALHGTIPWTVEINGASPIHRHARRVGSASTRRRRQPRPAGLPVRRDGDRAHRWRRQQRAPQRPSGVPVAVRLAGGVSACASTARAAACPASSARRADNDSPDRYELEVLGGAPR